MSGNDFTTPNNITIKLINSFDAGTSGIVEVAEGSSISSILRQYNIPLPGDGCYLKVNGVQALDLSSELFEGDKVTAIPTKQGGSTL